MDKLKKAALLLRDLLEQYIPGVLFLAFFGLFVLQIILRSVFKVGMPWSEEVCSICYTWIVFLTASFAERTHDNIYFPLIHDALSEKAKRVVDFLHQVILVAFYIFITPCTLDLYRFFGRKYTTLLRVPLSIAYGGFVVFIVFSVIRAVWRMAVILRDRPQGGKPSEKGGSGK